MCISNRLQTDCSTEGYVTAGDKTVKDKDDATCATYKHERADNTTHGNAKSTTCDKEKFVAPGSDSTKDKDDTQYTTGADGKIKTGTHKAQPCQDKKTQNN